MTSAVHPTTDIAKILRHFRFVPTGDIAPLVSIPAIDVFFCSRATTGACRNPWELQEAALVLSAGIAALFFTIANCAATLGCRHEMFTPLASIGE
jgi:hypothetical protein